MANEPRVDRIEPLREGRRSLRVRRRRGVRLSRVVSSLFLLVYIVIGAVVAASHHYFEHLNAVKPIASAALAVLLWPLILFGVSLHLK